MSSHERRSDGDDEESTQEAMEYQLRRERNNEV